MSSPLMLPEWVKPFAEWSAAVLEIFGVGVIVFMAAFVVVAAVVRIVRRAGRDEVFRASRLELSRGILLGLEFLVGADIIHTVAVDLTYASVGVLAIVVVIRTFLSFTLEAEISGRLPWHTREKH